MLESIHIGKNQFILEKNQFILEKNQFIESITFEYESITFEYESITFEYESIHELIDESITIYFMNSLHQFDLYKNLKNKFLEKRIH